MGSGDGDAGEDRSEEPRPPSVADVLDEIPRHERGSASAEGSGEPASDDESGAGPTFADLTADVRRRRAREDDDPRSDAPARPARDSHGPEREGSDAAASDDAESQWPGGTAGREGTVDLATKLEVIVELIDDASNVLLLGRLHDAEQYGVCPSLLEAGGPTNRVLVTFSQSPDERLALCRGPDGEFAGETTIVSVGDPARSGGGSSTVHGDAKSVTVKNVTDPRDVVRTGITISRAISAFEDPDRPTSLCFHSLSDLLQFVEDRQSVFRFLHILCGRVDAADAMAHYHLDPDAHEDRVVSLLRPLFDVTLRIGDDGTVSIDEIP